MIREERDAEAGEEHQDRARVLSDREELTPEELAFHSLAVLTQGGAQQGCQPFQADTAVLDR